MLDNYATYQTLPFNKLSSSDFERLGVWLVKSKKFSNVNHLGGTNDNGQDIVGELNNKSYTFQCKRTNRFSFVHAKEEINKILSNVSPRPDFLVFITNAKVSARTIKKARKLWGDEKSCLFWYGFELDYEVKQHNNILNEFFSLDRAWGKEKNNERIESIYSQNESLQVYLTKLKNDNRFLDIRGLPNLDVFNLELNQIYTRLRVLPKYSKFTSQSNFKIENNKNGDSINLVEDSLESFKLKDLVSNFNNIVLEGKPGSGKTTFLRFIVLNASKALLGIDKLKSLNKIGLKGVSPFPIYINLNEFDTFLTNQKRNDLPKNSIEHFLNFLDFVINSVDPFLNKKFLKNNFIKGNCILLFDGLDEIPNQKRRRIISEIIDQIAVFGIARNNKHIVTSRSRAYMGSTQLNGDFTRAKLLDFNKDEIELFIENWSKAIHFKDESKDLDKILGHGQKLLKSLDKNKKIREIAGNPLMLTVMSIMHFNGTSELSSQRGTVYEMIITHLLSTRASIYELSEEQRMYFLMNIALNMQQGTSNSQNSMELSVAKINASKLYDLSKNESKKYLELETILGGIIIQKKYGEIGFWHLSFQEYLAARYLSQEEDYFKLIKHRLHDDRWLEVIKYLASCLIIEGKSKVVELINNIIKTISNLEDELRIVGLVGNVLRNLDGDLETIINNTGYKDLVKKAFLISLSHENNYPLNLRLDVFDAFGVIGDYRFSEFNSIWTLIKSGDFYMGSQKNNSSGYGFDLDAHIDESPVKLISIESFKISKYLVTVCQFKLFVDSDKNGYTNSQFWSKKGNDWRIENNSIGPKDWEDQLAYSNRPVVGLSWYEAEAYCNWYSEVHSVKCRLPSEAEWEFVAKGKTKGKYATQKGYLSSENLNFNQNVGSITPVGLYPSNLKEYEVYDLIGNVWEWCQDSWCDNYNNLSKVGKPQIIKSSKEKVRRGGSWIDSALRCRSTFRSRRGAGYLNNLIGFRPVIEI